MRNKRIIILVVVLLLGIGFAAISQTYYFNTTINIAKRESSGGGSSGGSSSGGSTTVEDLEIVFDSSFTSLDNGTLYNGSSSSSYRNFYFSSNYLTNIGDYAYATFRIVNKSQYDATITSFSCSGSSDNYIKLEKYGDLEAGDVVAKNGGTSDSYTIKFTMIQSYPDDYYYDRYGYAHTSTDFVGSTCTFGVTASN